MANQQNTQNSSIFFESETCSVVSNYFWPCGLYSPWNFPGQNTGEGSLSLLQGIFPTQGSNPGLLHCRRILYQLSYEGKPPPPKLILIFWYTQQENCIFSLLSVTLLIYKEPKLPIVFRVQFLGSEPSVVIFGATLGWQITKKWYANHHAAGQATKKTC